MKRQPVTNVLIENLSNRCIDLEEGIRRHTEGEIEELLVNIWATFMRTRNEPYREW